jgi:hypothetical protein
MDKNTTYWYGVDYERQDGEIGFNGESSLTVGVKDGTISEIVSDDTISHQYSISPLLTEFGLPDEVFVWKHAVTTSGIPNPVEIVLDYRSQGFWATYSLIGQLDGGNVIFCPESRIPWLHLFAPERKMTDDEMFDATFGAPDPGSPPLTVLSVQDATGMDLETFYQTFTNPSNQKCLETPARLWD